MLLLLLLQVMNNQHVILVCWQPQITVTAVFGRKLVESRQAMRPPVVRHTSFQLRKKLMMDVPGC
jgi:hypothetical protein